jgi:hypothetical protein
MTHGSGKLSEKYLCKIVKTRRVLTLKTGSFVAYLIMLYHITSISKQKDDPVKWTEALTEIIHGLVQSHITNYK